MQKKKNDVKARTTLLLSLHDEHQLRFTEGSETLEQTFNRLQVIVGQLQFMDVEIEQDDLNQKFLTSLALEWLMHTIVWRNRTDLDTISLYDLYNHLKVYESEVHKKSKPNSQNMAFISSAKHSSGNEDGNTACVPTASTNVPTTSASVATINQDTACAYIASQSSEKKISIQGSDVAGFDKLKVECFNYHKMGHFARECRAPRSQDRGKRDNYRQGSKAEEQALKALMAIDRKLETLKQEKEGVDGKLAGLLTASKDLDNLIESQRDLSWTGLLEFADDTVTDYSRPSPTMESTSGDDQNRNPSVSETVASPITPKPFIKFVKPKDSQSKSKTDETETPKKPLVKKRVKKSFTPRLAIHRLMRPVRPNMNGAQPKRTSFHKPAHSYVRRPFQETTQDLMIILIQRVQRLERELKARTPIHKVDRGRSMPVMAWVPKMV
nr:hypothetical protein [Tanacetum cinerariifolium]